MTKLLRPVHAPLLFLLIVLAVWAAGCAGQECSTITDPQLSVTFAQYTNAAKTTEKNITVAFTSIYGVDGKPDSSFVDSKAEVGRVRLQLSQNADTTSFVFVRQDGTTDTLTLAYTRQPFFISQACGFEMRYNDLTVVNHTFPDAPVILKSAVTTAVNEVHIKIYY